MEKQVTIATSILSKRWRHVWCDIPSLTLVADTVTADSLNETLTRFTAPKMMDFHLKTTMKQSLDIPHIDRWITFAMSHNVENMSLHIASPGPYYNYVYKLPDFFYINSSVKQLTVYLSKMMIPRCSVSWTSLHKLSLRSCILSDEFIAKILSGCPLLESLALYSCNVLEVLDLSKSPRLTTLEVYRNLWVRGPTQIVAPHVHCLRLRNSHLPCTLVDVASLTEAKLDISFDTRDPRFEANDVQVMLLNMLEKLENVEKLTFGGSFLQILSLAELRGVPFPKFKVKALTLETSNFQYVIPGIERLLQNSPGLEKLTVRTRDCNTIQGEYLDIYLKLQGLDPKQCGISGYGVFWNKCRYWNVELKHVVSLMELVLKNTKTLDKMVVLLDERYPRFKVEELLPTLSHNNNVSILLSTYKAMALDEWCES